MLLRTKTFGYRVFFGLGNTLFIIGGVLLILSGAFGQVINPPLPDFLRGFMIGLSIVVGCVSIYLNITGLIAFRKHRKNTPE